MSSKVNKVLLVVTVVVLLGMAVGWLFYECFAHQLVEAMYEGRSVGILNGLIQYQYKKPLEHYLKLADTIFYRTIFLFSASLALAHILYRLRSSMGYREPLVMSNREPQLSSLVRGLLVLTMAVAAALTVVTHIAQISGMSFSMYATIGVCVVVIVAGLVLWSEFSKQVLRTVIAERMPAVVLLSCSLLGGLLCLVSYRGTLDDSYYVPNVIYYLEHPDEAMGFKIHFVDSGSEEPFVSYHFGSLPFEYSQGIVSYITGTHFLTVHYFFSPALFGCMIPLVWFYLISRFSFTTRAAIAGAVFICLSLLLMGERHRSFGNLAFNRIHEGKIVMFAVGFPLFIALTMDFFRSPSGRKWLYLLFTAVAMVGLSTSAAVLIPMLALVLAASCCFSYVSNMKSRFLYSLCYFCSLFYPVLYAGSVLLVSLDQLVSQKNPLNTSWPETFSGHANFVLNGPVVIVFLILGTIVAVVLVQKRDSRFLVMWIVVLLLCYLNPLVMPFVTKYVTTPSIYWRVFYLLPFPLVVGLSGAALALWLENKSPKWRRIVFTGATVLLLAAHVPVSSSSVFRRGPRVTRLGLPRRKVIDLHYARDVLTLSPPPGTMLAMSTVSMKLPMLTAQYPQICIRPHAIYMWMAQRGTLNEAVHRTRAQSFLEDTERKTRAQSFLEGIGINTKKNPDSLVWVIRRYPQIRSVVADRRVAHSNNSYLFRLLEELGFTEHKSTSELVVFIRPASG